MRRIIVTVNGNRVDAGSFVEKAKGLVKKMTGVDVDTIEETQALLLCANVTGQTVPEFLGF